MGMRTALVLLVVLGVAMAAPPSPTATKRSAEDIQFGNQQNPPVSLLDDNALPGAFPSSETSEEIQPSKEPTEDTEAAPKKPAEVHPDPPHREEVERDLPPVALASRWQFHGPRTLYRPRQFLPAWSLPLASAPDSFLSRRRRSAPHPPSAQANVRRSSQVSPRVLKFGHRHKRDLRPLGRFPRDINSNLDNLLRDVDVVEVLGMLARAPHRNQGYGTLSYAPLSPTAPRYAPQPRFTEYEDEDEDDGVDLLTQGSRAPQRYSDNVVMPSGGRVWRRSGGYGLSAVPGFKRSAFRANTFQPPPQHTRNQDDDVYSLAAMLGAEVDPVTHRIQRAAM